jgi:lipopolysaccharide/colanic/teichoic acid biosynthesis glycosyltransferase
LDELPQLINILKGDMSIVGPRPTLPEFKDIYEDWELEKFSERPGLTGLAQINGNIYLERIEKSRYDVKYVRNICFLSDMKIILKTVQIVIFGEDKFLKRDESKTDKEASADEEHSIHRLSYFK